MRLERQVEIRSWRAICWTKEQDVYFGSEGCGNKAALGFKMGGIQLDHSSRGWMAVTQNQGV